jgi:hypothetical protein
MQIRGFLIMSGSLVAGLQTFTEVLAYKAHYARAALGPALWQVDAFYTAHALYWPWQGIRWAFRWGGMAPDTVRLAALLALVPVVMGIGLGMLLQGTGRRTDPPALTGHGTTQWAKTRDVKEAGLL